jgi:hypothetical protein
MSTLASNAYHAIALTHIAAGTLALVTYWTAALSRKTRYSLHVRAGNLYLWAMRAILVTAVPMAGAAFLKGQTAVGIFLSYLVVLVATTVYTAPKAVQCKQDFERFRGGAFRALAISLPAVAAATFVYGVVVSNLLLGGFSIVGLVVGWQMWVTLRRTAAPAAGWWLKEHYGAMLGNGVGTHIAFLAIGLGRVLPPELAEVSQLIAWFGPLTVSTVATILLDRRHRARFGAAA